MEIVRIENVKLTVEEHTIFNLCLQLLRDIGDAAETKELENECNKVINAIYDLSGYFI